MKILRVQRKNDETGELEFTAVLTEPQTQFLLDLAINYLIQMGIASFQDQVEAEPTKETTLEEAMTDIMNQANPKDLPQA